MDRFMRLHLSDGCSVIRVDAYSMPIRSERFHPAPGEKIYIGNTGIVKSALTGRG